MKIKNYKFQIRVSLSLIILAVTIIIGVAFRFANINWDSFLAFHPDERNIAWAVTRIHFFDQLNPKFFAYGGLPIYLYRALGEAVVFITKDPSWLTEWGKIAVIGRFVSALLSSISVLLIYQVATRYFSKRTGLLSALLLAFSPWAIQQAHFATTETMLVFFLLLLLLLAKKVYETGDGREGNRESAGRRAVSKHRHGLGEEDSTSTKGVWTLAMRELRHADLSTFDRWIHGRQDPRMTSVLSGGILGLALAAKTTSVLFAVIPLAALWLPDKISPWRKFVKHELWTKLRATIVIFLTAAGTFLIFSPYTVIDRVHFLESMRYETGVVIGKFTVPYTLQFLGTTPYLYQFQTMLWQAGVVVPLGVIGILAMIIKILTRAGDGRKENQERAGRRTFRSDGHGLGKEDSLSNIEVWTLAVARLKYADLSTFDRGIRGRPASPELQRGEQDPRARTEVRYYIVFLIFPLLYLAWSGSWFAKFSRYNVPFLPFLTIAGAWLIIWVTKKMYVVWCDRIVQHTTPSSFFFIGRIGLLVGLVGLHALWGVANWSIYLRPQTRIEASKWMYQHIPASSLIYTEHWNDGLPVTPAGITPVSFRRELVTPYEQPDNESKREYWVTKLAVSDYLIFTTPRISRTMPKLTEKYPVTSAVYQLIFNGQLGYQEVATFTSYPQLFGIPINDDAAEETISIFDHPKVQIFQNIQKYSKEELKRRLMSRVGS